MFQHAQITDAPLYLEDRSLVGHCKEFNIPELETTQIEHESLGSVGILMLPRRGLSTMTGSMTMEFADPEFMTLTANPRKGLLFQLHSKLDVNTALGLDEEQSTTIVTIVTALFSKQAFPGGKKDGKGEFVLDFSCTKLLQRDIKSSTPIVEIDLFANIHRVNGEDAWPN